MVHLSHPYVTTGKTIRGSDQNYPKEKEMQEGEVVVCGGLTNSQEEKQKAKETGKDIPN